MITPSKIWTLIGLLCICWQTALGMTATDSLMKQLDDVIANRDVYLRQKDARLSELHSQLLTKDNDRERFDILNHLYDNTIPSIPILPTI